MRSEVTENKFQRREYLINRRVQLTFLFYALGVTVNTVAVLVLLRRPAVQELLASLESSAFERSRILSLALIIGACFILLTINVFLGLVLSHRIAGPIYRLVKHMADVRDGKVDPETHLKFRKNDFFKESAEVYNEMVKKLKNGPPAE